MFYQLAFHRIDRSVRWVSLGTGAAWLPPGGAEFEAQIVFVDPRRRVENIVLVDSTGRPLDTQSVEPVGELVAPVERFNAEPDHAKSFFRATFRLDSPDVVIAQSSPQEGSEPLFSLVPTLSNPTFLFDILQLARSQVPDVRFATLVETGTLYAHTAFHASHWFDQVISVELDVDLNRNAAALGLDRIEFRQGDSGTVIPELVHELDGPAVFFLDAHWSGDATVDWDKSRFRGFPTATAHLGDGEAPPSSTDQVPLDKELNAILDDFAHHAIIIIDDWESVGTKDHAFAGEDWSHLSEAGLLAQLRGSERTLFAYRYDAKHFVVGIKPR